MKNDKVIDLAVGVAIIIVLFTLLIIKITAGDKYTLLALYEAKGQVFTIQQPFDNKLACREVKYQLQLETIENRASGLKLLQAVCINQGTGVYL